MSSPRGDRWYGSLSYPVVFVLGVGLGVAGGIGYLASPRTHSKEELAQRRAAYELFQELTKAREAGAPDPDAEHAFVEMFGETELGSSTRDAQYAHQVPHIRVGPEGAELNGSSYRVIQAAIDHISVLGGGVVELLPGEYLLRNSVVLRSGVALVGAGPDTVLKKAPGAHSPLVRDLDWYENRFELLQPAGFEVGDGVLLQAHPRAEGGLGGYNFAKVTVTSVDGPTLHVRDRVGKNFWTEHRATAVSSYALIRIEGAHDVRIESLRLDGDREHNRYVDGNLAGGVFVKNSADVTIRKIDVRAYHGDGFSIQASERVHMEDCSSVGQSGLGVHVGGGSHRVVVRNTVSRENHEGLYFCWGVTESLVEGGEYSHNRTWGLTLGHRDTNNVIRNVLFEGNGAAGVEFRSALGTPRGAHRNRLEGNTFRDNGADDGGWAVGVTNRTYGVVLVGNRFENSEGGPQRIGIRAEPDTELLELEGNVFTNTQTELDVSTSLKRRVRELVTAP